jgi:flagellar biosynthesis protein
MDNKKHKKIKEAAALRYSPENNGAPILVAAGKGEVAEGIIEKARESDVPIYKDDNLAQSLGMLKLGEEIPAELYGVVAEILVFVSKIDSRFEDRYDKKRE